MSNVPIAIQRDGADRFAVLPKGLLLNPERQLLIDIGDTRVGDLAQKIMQLRSHPKMITPNFPAKVPQINE
jgi:hypothetical protein